MWNFCSFGLKRRHLIFADFFFCRLKISAPKKIVCITGSNNRSDVTINNWCTLQWSLEVKTYLVLWNLFKGCSFWIRIWLTSNCLFTFFAIYFVGRKYKVNSWIDIGKMFDISAIYFLSNFHTLSYNIFFKRIMIRSNYIQFF